MQKLSQENRRHFDDIVLILFTLFYVISSDRLLSRQVLNFIAMTSFCHLIWLVHDFLLIQYLLCISIRKLKSYGELIC